MVQSKTLARLGAGLYTPAEAAYYARLAPQTLNRWLLGDDRHNAVAPAQFGSAEEKVLTFLDLVQSLAIQRARAERVPLQKIRQAVRRAKEDYGVEFPLAMDHRLLLFDGDLHIEFPSRELHQVSGRFRGQRLMREIAEPFMSDLSFGDRGFASRYTAWVRHGREIVLDPRIQFGQPIVGSSGYPSTVLMDAYRAEGSVDRAAAAFGVDREDVLLAIDYHDHLDSVAA